MNIENSLTQLQTKFKQLEDMKSKIGVQGTDGHRYRSKVNEAVKATSALVNKCKTDVETYSRTGVPPDKAKEKSQQVTVF